MESVVYKRNIVIAENSNQERRVNKKTIVCFVDAKKSIKVELATMFFILFYEIIAFNLL